VCMNWFVCLPAMVMLLFDPVLMPGGRICDPLDAPVRGKGGRRYFTGPRSVQT
jgi:hypothetical protein